MKEMTAAARQRSVPWSCRSCSSRAFQSYIRVSREASAFRNRSVTLFSILPIMKWMPVREALLYAASRRQHLVEKIIPALEQGTHVICDRFIDSSLAYQGMGREIGMQEVYDMNLFATQGMLPDLTLFLDISLEEAMERVCKRGGKDRLDLESDAFHQRVREGYERVKELYPQRIHVVDAHQSIDEVKEACIREIRMLLKQYE